MTKGTCVALPPAELCTSCAEYEKWRKMSQKEFMDKYGDDVLSGYILPTPDELEQAEQEEGEEEEVQGDLESLADEEE